MFKHYSVLVLLICDFGQPGSAHHRDSSSWSTLNLLINPHRYSHINPVNTTQTFGIVIRSTEPLTTTGSSNSDPWTKIKVSRSPSVKDDNSRFTKVHPAAVGNTVPAIIKFPRTSTPSSNVDKRDNFETSISYELMTWANRSLHYLNVTNQPPGSDKHNEKGHAFLDDVLDDDDYDDEDDDDDDENEDEDEVDDDDEEYEQEEYNKKETDEVEEVENPSLMVDESANAIEKEPMEEYDNYTERKPTIILRTRRKNKYKYGKKHGKIKIKKKYLKKLKKFILPLLLVAYKLKFFTLVPLLLGGLVLIISTTSFAGFFFALFAVRLGMKNNYH